MAGSGETLEGYVTEVDYPTRLIPQLTPGWIAAVAAWQGMAAPDLRGAFRMLDIGCGTGIALAMSAACHPDASFEGLDGMASHIAAGQAFTMGVDNLALVHTTFGDALKTAQPDCDIITVHGVLSWAGAQARRDAMALAAARLVPGGLLVASYNAYPGAARQLTFQHLVRHITAAAHGAPGERFRTAFGQISQMADAGFNAVESRVVNRLADLARDAPDDYFVHEYMHDGWAPLWPAEVKARFDELGLSYIGQADFLRQRPDLCLTARQRALIDAADPADRDLMIDMALDTPFRIDLYAREPRPGPGPGTIWVAAEAEAGGRIDVDLPGGDVMIDQHLGQSILEALEDGPLTLADLVYRANADALAVRQMVETLLIGDLLVPVSPPLPQTPSAAQTLAARLAAQAAADDDLPIAAVGGRAGPVLARPIEIAMLGFTGETFLARADTDNAFRSRFLDPGLDLANPLHRRRAMAGLDRLHARFRRLGVDPPCAASG